MDRRRGPRPRVRRVVPWWEQFGVWAYLDGKAVHLIRYSRGGHPIGYSRVMVAVEERQGTLAAIGGEVEFMLKKQADRRVADDPAGKVVDPKWAGQYPTLYDHMTQTEWDDGTPRETSSLLVFCDGRMAKAMLRDRAGGLCCWVACDTLSGLFAVLEAALRDPRTEWRQDRKVEGQKASRVKRPS